MALVLGSGGQKINMIRYADDKAVVAISQRATGTHG